MTSDVVGYVETVDADRMTVSGWVALSRGEIPELRCALGDAQVDAVQFGAERSDVRAVREIPNISFTIGLPSILWPGALLSDGLRVWADGRPLAVSGRFRESEAALMDRVLALSGERDPDPTPGFGTIGRVTSADDISALPVPVGTMCSDESAVVGRAGHLFLRKGSNELASRYRVPRSAGEKSRFEQEVAGWTAVLEKRVAVSANFGAQFIQIMVPEKSTAIDSGVAEISGVTATLGRLEEIYGDKPWYISGRSVLSDQTGAAGKWLRLDSHISTTGAAALFGTVAARIDPGFAPPEAGGTERIALPGDLSVRFFGSEVAEIDDVPRSPFLDRLAAGVELVERNDPPPESPNRWIGIHRVWRNPEAPIRKTVVAFGNSYFGDVSRSARLNWWCSRMFSEHHFLWTPWIDFAYVRKVAPDVVIGQTVERFLGGVPADRGL